jgi:hypothetical protein
VEFRLLLSVNDTTLLQVVGMVLSLYDLTLIDKSQITTHTVDSCCNPC